MNYKINVKNEEESERCQKALFAIGYVWGESKSQRILSFERLFDYITTYSKERLIYNNCEIPPFEEITVEGIEKIAADYLLKNSSIQYEAVTIAESPDEAQKRYEAALAFFINERQIFDSTDLFDAIEKALKIAAGLSQ